MKKLIPLFALVGLAACSTGSDYDTVVVDCDVENCDDGVVYSSPNGNDLLVDNGVIVIKVDAQPGKSYRYNIWNDINNTDGEPDIVIEDGQVIKKQ